MKSAIDPASLIACSACAKAKTRCDKQLPTCSRCLYKRLKCEPRPTRRYPETAQYLHIQTDQAQTQAQARIQTQAQTSPLSTSPSPPNLDNSTANESFNQILSTNPDISYTQSGFHVQWSPPPLSTADLTCPGDLSLNNVQSNSRERFDARPSDVYIPFQTDTEMMDYPFTNENLGFQSAELLPLVPNSEKSPRTSHTATESAFGAQNQVNRAVIELNKPVLDDWPSFQCNPQNAQAINPKLGSQYLRRLEDTLNDQSIWNNVQDVGPNEQTDFGIDVESVQGSLRDKLMVISQWFLNRARDIHRPGSDRTDSSASVTGFFILPPPPVLEAFLRIYSSRVEPHIPFFPEGRINLTQLIASNDEKSSTLLILLMVAYGAMGSTSSDAQNLANGLLEICRICMFDIVEKNVQMTEHPIILRCALLYLSAAAWNGNRWHMDLSAAQFRMYISMLRHARMLNARTSCLSDVALTATTETAWKSWQSEETLNRLTCSWVMLDQELSLFHDRQPDLEISELNAPMPGSDELWAATSAEIWHKIVVQNRQSHLHDPGMQHSLAELFGSFMSGKRVEPTSLTELRLLLHPLQALMYHLNKSVVYLYSCGNQRFQQRLASQLEEVQYLLKEWYVLCRQALDRRGWLDPNGCSNMIMYHLISLNAITYFPDIEKLARGDVLLEIFQQSLWAGKRCSEEASQIWSHCGQVIRYFRQMPAQNRPYWWNASIYRIALCLWATSLSSKIPLYEASSSRIERVSIDALSFDHPSIARYLRHGDGYPVLTNSDGSLAVLRMPIDIVQHCVGLLRETARSQFDKEIIARLEAMVERWTGR